MALRTAPGPVSSSDRAAFTVHGQDTLPRLFRHVVRERGDRVALREKHLGMGQADLDGSIQTMHEHLRRTVFPPQPP